MDGSLVISDKEMAIYVLIKSTYIDGSKGKIK